MKKDTLKSGPMVKIAKEHKNELGGRRGMVAGLNHKQLQIANEKEVIEEVKPEPFPPGWIEFYI